MREMYSIQIPNEKAATYKVATFIIAFINLLTFGYLLFYTGNHKNLVSIGLTISLMAVVFYIVKLYSSFLQNFRIEIAFIICAIVWIISGNYLPGSLLLLFAILGLITNKKQVIHFNKEGILYPSFPSKMILWMEVDFVILKDGILTIELKNNKLMQFTLEKKMADDLDATSFNTFCNMALGNPVL